MIPFLLLELVPLHYAIINEREDMVRTLMLNGADPMLITGHSLEIPEWLHDLNCFELAQDLGLDRIETLLNNPTAQFHDPQLFLDEDWN